MIADCFCFFNELELLKARCEILKDVVDVFVLVESRFTFTGERKILFFEENKHLFDQYNIHHVICDDMPNNGNAWDNEYHQRSKICPVEIANDWLIIGDLDEIPDPGATINAHRNGERDKFYVFRGPTCYYKMTWMSVIWDGSKIVHRSYMNKVSGDPAQFRNIWQGEDRITIDGGWHFSYLLTGEIDESIRYKMNSFSHTEFRNEIDRTISDAKKMIDPRRRGLSRMSISELPEYIQKNQDHYRQIGWID